MKTLNWIGGWLLTIIGALPAYAWGMWTGCKLKAQQRRRELARVKFPNGPCATCGRPNVRRGRETGVYICESCLNGAATGLDFDAADMCGRTA